MDLQEDFGIFYLDSGEAKHVLRSQPVILNTP